MSWNPISKPSVDSWNKLAKPSDKNSFLLKEDGYYLLLETGGKIIILVASTWNPIAKPI